MTATTATSDITAAPGAVTRYADLPRELHLPGAAVALGLTYWTRTSRDEPALSSGALFIPSGTAPTYGWPVIVWTHGTTGLADSCAPSADPDLGGYREYLISLLGQGYAIAATDYIGLGTPGVHTYMDGYAEAHAAIDALRAARAINGSLSASWAAMGHSQGGQAALFTAAIATRYAPGLDYRGAVVLAPGLGTVSSFLAAAHPGLPDIFVPQTKAYAVYILCGLKSARPEFDLDSYLTALGKEVIADAERLCLSDMAERMTTISLASLLSRPLTEEDFGAIARPVLDIPLTGYDRPFLVVQGLLDTDCPAERMPELLLDLQAHDVEFSTRMYPDSDHMTVLQDSAADVDAYLDLLFARTASGR
ncbi:alpha/beta hydrolase family protein [Nocardia sp. CA-128927]|uniref:alpha/beta hydrolase family protein n=1 Tax=Nocardia sp. CA-128927 TaxID=3239975 RepID=UPI003D952D0E